MNFTFTTEYTVKSLSVMAKGLRKTLRSRKNRRSHVFGWIVVALAILLLIPRPGEIFQPTVSNIITAFGCGIIIYTLIFEDHINGFFAHKRMIEGMSPAVCTFEEDSYTSSTAVGTTTFGYENIKAIAENNDYFVFLMDKNHGQLYDKSTIIGGTIQQFSRFITEKTNMTITKF